MKILCSICGRGGSKGVKNKNLVKINGKPLIYYSIKQAKNSKIFDKIALSTDNKKIQSVAKKYGASSWFIRKKQLSTSKAPKIPVIRDNLIKSEKYFKTKFDYIVDLDISAPLRNHADIKNAFKKFIRNKYDNLFSVYKSKKSPYFNMIEIIKKKIF